MLRYVDATDDEQFAREAGVEMLVETARLWMSLGHWGRDERFHVFGVTGPGRVQRAGRRQRLHQPDAAAEPARSGGLGPTVYRESAEPLEVTPRRDRAVGTAADAVFVPYDEELGVHPQTPASR